MYSSTYLCLSLTISDEQQLLVQCPFATYNFKPSRFFFIQIGLTYRYFPSYEICNKIYDKWLYVYYEHHLANLQKLLILCSYK